MQRRRLRSVSQWGVVSDISRSPSPGLLQISLLSALALIVTACSSEPSATWCADAERLTTFVADYRELDEVPDAANLRERLEAIVASREATVAGAAEDVRDSFAALGVATVDLDRVLSRYGYDLLRAQSESDTVEQADLVALDGVPVLEALTLATARVVQRCTGA